MAAPATTAPLPVPVPGVVVPAPAPAPPAEPPCSPAIRQAFDAEPDPPSYGTSIVMILKNSTPSAARMFFLILSQNIAFAYVGKYLSSDALAGISAGVTFLWMIGIFPAMGISCAADTLCAQEYGRDKQSKMLGVFARRGIIVNLLYSIPVLIVALNAEAILNVMFDPIISVGAAAWLRYSVLYLFPPGQPHHPGQVLRDSAAARCADAGADHRHLPHPFHR